MVLSGYVREPEVDQNAKALAEEFRELRDEIATSTLPDDVRTLILSRINQISAVLDHIAFFGVMDLERELSSLAGALLINKPKIAEKSGSLGQKMLHLLSKGLGIVATANKSVDEGQATFENGKEIYSLLENMF